MNIEDKLPKAEEVLKEVLDKIAKKEGHDSWIDCRFRENSTSIELLWQQATKAFAHEYTRQVLDVVAENGNVIYTGDPIQYAEVDKKSILKFKDILK